jgi:hypothetical protein
MTQVRAVTRLALERVCESESKVWESGRNYAFSAQRTVRRFERLARRVWIASLTPHVWGGYVIVWLEQWRSL